MDKLFNLGIDPWSILIYFVNTGIIVLLLTRFLYKPLLGFIDKRREAIADSLAQAAIIGESFEAQIADAKAEKAKLELELREELANLTKFLETKRSEMIAEMNAARAEMLQKAQIEIEEKKARIIKDAEKDVMNLITRVVLDIVQNKVPENVIGESVGEAWKNYTK